MNTPEPTTSLLPDLDALRVGDLMQRDLVTVQASDPLTEVERVLADARVGGVPVLDDDGDLLGILTLRDLVDRYAADATLPAGVDVDDLVQPIEETEPVAFRRDDDGLCAGDLMTTDVVTVTPDTRLRHAARRMAEDGVHRLLVVDRGKVVGILSTMDVVRVLAG
jgi:CBS domain-containing protein